MLCSPVIAQDVSPALITGTAKVTDGDGLTIGPVRIRLHGIDAPEDGQTCAAANGSDWSCGANATRALMDLASGKAVTCEAREQDGYGRIISICSIDGQDLSEYMMRNGLAWAYREYSLDYVDLEEVVRGTQAGVWQAPTQTPWEFRGDRWQRAVDASPGGCPIKGNIARDGERIYHTPWSKYYGRTQINVAAGERWFCDEAEATAAGWREARGG
ncbi:thermonuclease family protein [Salipiger sp. IMCC34102]|uniref:thermonuclease family protein n=1 Tax=Salipiger sp. IMCC34102 TaxID=2510647 RepID=UPI0013ED1210